MGRLHARAPVAGSTQPDRRLRQRTRFLACSTWEVIIKRRLGRQDFQADPRRLRRGLLENGYAKLAISSDHTLAVDLLPPIHKDPFDRLLVAQALTEGLPFVTADRQLPAYPGDIRPV